MAHLQLAHASHTVELFMKPVSTAVRSVLAAIDSANMHHAEREIARFIGPDANLTDETERRVEQLLLRNHW